MDRAWPATTIKTFTLKLIVDAGHEALCRLVQWPGRGGRGAFGFQRETAEEVTAVALTRDFKKTVVARVERDPAFAKELLHEATTLFISGEAETARAILRDLINATLGFERLAKLTDFPSKSLHRMLSPKGNPSMDNLAAIFGAVSRKIDRGTRHTRPRKVA